MSWRGDIKQGWTLKSKSGKASLYQGRGLVVRPSKMVSTSSRWNALNRHGITGKETGYVDTTFAAYLFNTTGSIALIPTIAQGASVNQRVGKKVVLKSLQCRGSVANDTTAVFNDCALLIVYDKRPTGALPAITDILVTATSQSMNNDNNSGRFKILKRLDFSLIGNATTPTEKSFMSADFFLSLNNLPMVFKSATSGTIADIEEGALYLVTVGDTAAGAADAIASLGFRTRFVDI